MSPARRVLERLLRRAERDRLRGAVRAVSLSMHSARDAAEYLALGPLVEVERFHAEIALAERDGAIEVRRDRHRGDGSQLLGLSVADPAALARHLGRHLLSESAAAAEQALAPWIARFPVVAEVLSAWRQGRTVRGRGVDHAADLADAAYAAAACLDRPGGERVLRAESTRLFKDSKRLERLTLWLDVLVSGRTSADGSEPAHVWAGLGLRREPQPLLISGVGRLLLDGAELPLLQPYLGVPPEAVRALTTAATYLMTVENLASFHDAARSAGRGRGLLLYTGGMPSPAWRDAYLRILRGLPAGATVYHWGDIDEGGFRIAASLAHTARSADRSLTPWLMSPDALAEADCMRATVPARATQSAMCRWAERAGWPDVAAALARRPVSIEQESLLPVFPCDTA